MISLIDYNYLTEDDQTNHTHTKINPTLKRKICSKSSTMKLHIFHLEILRKQNKTKNNSKTHGLSQINK